ncbi:MAG: type I methionyl aminopeptidase [Candidatus Paceibacterota bacterium]
MVRLKSEKDLELLRISGRILAATLRALSKEVKAGVILSNLDKKAKELILKEGATPTFLGYTPEGATKAYAASICASVNETIVHGLPGKYILKEGDIISIDLGVTYKGYVTDGAVTVGVGNISEEARALLRVTHEALQNGIEECIPGKHLGDIGYAIEKTAQIGKFRVIQGLTGHGVGFALHEDPSVFNYGKRGEGMKLVPGLVIAIEPMFSVKSPYIQQKKDDSFATKDGSLSAHFEHTVVITEEGFEVLTA